MATKATSYCETFWRSDLKAWLRCDSECGFELAVGNSSGQFYHQADLEIWLQPRGDDGLASGNPIRLAVLRVPLRRLPGGQSLWGHVTLPAGLNAAAAQRCHFRVHLLPPSAGNGNASHETNQPAPTDE